MCWLQKLDVAGTSRCFTRQPLSWQHSQKRSQYKQDVHGTHCVQPHAMHNCLLIASLGLHTGCISTNTYQVIRYAHHRSSQLSLSSDHLPSARQWFWVAHGSAVAKPLHIGQNRVSAHAHQFPLEQDHAGMVVDTGAMHTLLLACRAFLYRTTAGQIAYAAGDPTSFRTLFRYSELPGTAIRPLLHVPLI